MEILMLRSMESFEDRSVHGNIYGLFDVIPLGQEDGV